MKAPDPQYANALPHWGSGTNSTQNTNWIWIAIYFRSFKSSSKKETITFGVIVSNSCILPVYLYCSLASIYIEPIPKYKMDQSE